MKNKQFADMFEFGKKELARQTLGKPIQFSANNKTKDLTVYYENGLAGLTVIYSVTMEDVRRKEHAVDLTVFYQAKKCVMRLVTYSIDGKSI